MKESAVIRVLGKDAALAEVVREAQREGADVLVVPAAADKRGSLERFAEVLRLPDWFGHNLDALADCLHDLAENPPQVGASGRHLVWDGTDELHGADPEAFEGICSVLEDVAGEHAGFTVTVIDR
jgi:RNAse (barnase) inhibitor barstar